MKFGEHVGNVGAFAMYDRFRSYVTVEDNVCAFFQRDFLAERGWLAAVVSEELSPIEAKKLASLCRQFGYTKAWALDINNFDSGFFYEIRLDTKVLSLLEETFVTPSYLVVEENERFMLVSDSDYYWEIAGSQVFLERFFQKSMEKVNREFMAATADYRRSASLIGPALARIAEEAMGRSAPRIAR